MTKVSISEARRAPEREPHREGAKKVETEVFGRKTTTYVDDGKEGVGGATYDAVIAKAQWKQYVVRVRGKMDTYNGNSRLKSHVLSAKPIAFAEESKLLLAEIAKYGVTPSSDAEPPLVKMEA